MATAHFEPNSIQFAKDNQVIIFCLPPHTMHESQPLDCSLFGPWNNTGKRHATSSTKRIPAKLSQSWTSAVSFGMLGSVLSPLQTSVVGLRKQECSRLIEMQCLSPKTAPYVQAVVLMVTVIMLMVAVGMVSTFIYLLILYVDAHSCTHSHLHSPAHTLSHAHPHTLHAYTHLHSSTHTYPHTPIHNKKHAYVYVHATSFIHCY